MLTGLCAMERFLVTTPCRLGAASAAGTWAGDVLTIPAGKAGEFTVTLPFGHAPHAGAHPATQPSANLTAPAHHGAHRAH